MEFFINATGPLWFQNEQAQFQHMNFANFWINSAEYINKYLKSWGTVYSGLALKIEPQK